MSGQGSWRMDGVNSRPESTPFTKTWSFPWIAPSIRSDQERESDCNDYNKYGFLKLRTISRDSL